MGKKIIKVIFSFLIIIMSFNVVALAENNDKIQSFEDTKESLESDESIKKFYKYVNELNLESEIIEGMDVKEYVEKFIETGKSPINISTVVQGLVSYMFKEVGLVVKFLLSVLVIALLSALLKNLQSAFNSDAISNIAFFAFYAITIMLLTSSFLLGLNIAKSVLQSLVDFMAVLMPVLVFLLSTAGGITSALTIDPVVLAVVSITPKIYIDFIFPLILMFFVLQFVNNLTTEHKISNICKLVKQIAMWAQGFVLTVFVGIMAIRGISASTIDAVTLKTAKFAVDNFIPIVGKSFSDAISTVAGYSLLLKSAISSVGLIVVIAIIVYPLIKMLMMLFSYRITAAVIQPVADKRMVDAISSVGDAMTMLFSSVLVISIIFFILIAIMSSAGKFVVGG
ncbi:stage III sporulation protein AE [Clostridium mediterraneense]|uniref:stage III sporulation protein AE n=1 Tax=Clostridium mediterraneense TaxID=1805472 RepID=UPI00082FEA2E|nr:stage III sporulation protein AE [Clostridium mediterraneense]